MSTRPKPVGKRKGAPDRRPHLRPAAGPSAASPRPSWERLRDELAERSNLTGPGIERVLGIVGDVLAGLERELETRGREIVEQRQFIERVVDALPVGLYVVDREYRVQLWNHTREIGLQGIARGEAIGRTIFEVLHRQSAESLRGEFDSVFSTGELQQFESESRASSGQGRPARTYRISKIPLALHGETVTHVISVGEDVTSWKEAEARVAQAEKLAAIGQLAAGVMHEINNPLATIAACAESMALQLESVAALAAPGSIALPIAQHAEYLQVIDAEVRRCKGIVDALLNFSRARPVTRAVVDLNAVIEQTLFLLKHHHRFRQRDVQLDLDHAAPLVTEGNTEQLIQVFMALLHNAVDAVEDREQQAEAAAATERRSPQRPSRAGAPAARGVGTVTVRTRRGAGCVMAEVADSGIGIPRSTRSKIFEPFFTTKPIGRGTGLGLSVCYGIVADHGGRMDVESEHGVGSTFRVVLPDGRSASASRTSDHDEGVAV